MSETLQNNSESAENEQKIGLDEAELAASGLSRIVDEENSSDSEDDSYDSYDESYDDEEYEDDYDEDEEYEDDYDDEYDDEDYGEKRVEFDEEHIILHEIPLPENILKRYSFIGELPHGIAVMGGVARSIAREIITGDREPIRDIDLVNITDEDGNSEVDDEILDRLSREYMPDDYAFNHGIKNDTLMNYFKTRDFTINQCLIRDGKLIISDFAYDDFKENIIRPTYYECPYVEGYTRTRLFLKALLMRSVLSQISKSVPLIEDVNQPNYIDSFDLALFLNKAMSRGAETARIFTEDLAEWDVISGEYAGMPIALATELLGEVYNFEFRPSTDKRFMDTEECDDMGGFFIPPAMSSYYASDPAIRRAMAEYEDGPIVVKPGAKMEERTSGYYTQAEYDYINSFGTYDD
jgi:hypothetical protein